MTEPELSQRGRDYLAGAERFDGMTNGQFVKILETHEFDAADFQLILRLHEQVGGRVLPAVSDEAPPVRLGLVRGPASFAGKPLVPFVESSTGTFSWLLDLNGRVCAPGKSKTAPLSMLSDTLNVLLEGMALELYAWNRFGRPWNDFLKLDALEFNLPRNARLEAASDTWSTWWTADNFVIRASLDDSRDWVRASVWSDQDTPPRHVQTADWLRKLSAAAGLFTLD